MVEPTGATVAAFTLAVISWYGMLRTGLQLVHDDIESFKSVKEDIQGMRVELKRQMKTVQRWKRRWLFSEQTPDKVLLLYWGEEGVDLIKAKLKSILSNVEKAMKKLGEGGQTNSRWLKRIGSTLLFVYMKKKYVQDLIDRFPNDMRSIEEESDADWEEHRPIRDQEIEHATPDHVQAAKLLVEIAMHNLKDVDALQKCCQVAKDEVAIFLDLDLFDAFAAKTKDQYMDNIIQTHKVEHLKLELLIRESDRKNAELGRVIAERVTDCSLPRSRVVDAFKAHMSNSDCATCFASDASTLFRLSKHLRSSDPCSMLQHSLREIFSDQDPPDFDASTEQISNSTSTLGGLSIARAAFELAQACLLFLRTKWIRELCRCTVHCGVLSNMSETKTHRFGLDLVNTTHRPPRWRQSHQSEQYIDGSLEHSWCARNNHWYGLIRPIRRLGLLLVEVCLGTIVLPMTGEDEEGAAGVESMKIFVKKEPDPGDWVTVDLPRVLELIKQSYNDSEKIAGAIKYCLTGPFPASPSDSQMEIHLLRFYSKVVKPLRDIYDIQLDSGLL